MVGERFSLVPEGSERSLIELQNELATERANNGAFSKLVWIPPRLVVADERQRQVIEQLRADSRHSVGRDVLEAPLEDLRTTITSRLMREKTNDDAVATPAPGSPQLYLLYDKRDAGMISAWADVLFKECDVIHPGFERR